MERTYSGDHLLKSTGAPSADADIKDSVKAVDKVPRTTAPPSEILVIGILQVLSQAALHRGERFLLPGHGTFHPMYPFDQIIRFQIVDCLSIEEIVHCLRKICVILEQCVY